jgi:hypothetical protein
MAATQHTSQTWVHPDLHEDRHDFSLVLGGPLFQLLRKSHLEGDHLELLRQRMLVITGGAWLPLLLLSVLSTSDGNVGRLSFFHDVEVHVRFLIALPVLIGAELIVHSRIRPVVRRFVERRIVLPQDLARFERAIESAIRLRNSVLTELGLFLIVYTFGLLLWQSRVPILAPTWYALPGGRWHLTPAGYWYVFVSIPILQFILLRWYMRFIIWFRLLWQVSRLDLNLVSTHPDRCGGLAFLGKSAYAFGPILFAQGAMLAGVVAGRVLYRGGKLAVLQVTDWGLYSLLRLRHSRSSRDVYTWDGSRKKKGIVRIRPACSTLRRELRTKMGAVRSCFFRGIARI